MPQVLYVYLNSNPRGTVCPECARHIGQVYGERDRPFLPRHEHCYCYYERIVIADEPHDDGCVGEGHLQKRNLIFG